MLPEPDKKASTPEEEDSESSLDRVVCWMTAPNPFFFVSSLIACDLFRSWQYTHIRPCPRHYGSSFGHRRVVASSTPLDRPEPIQHAKYNPRHSWPNLARKAEWLPQNIALKKY